MSHKVLYKLSVSLFVVAVGLPEAAFAYIGPGTGLSAIGAFIALLAGLIVAILGFFWFPIKRILGRKNTQEPDQVNSKEE